MPLPAPPSTKAPIATATVPATDIARKPAPMAAAPAGMSTSAGTSPNRASATLETTVPMPQAASRTPYAPAPAWSESVAYTTSTGVAHAARTSAAPCAVSTRRTVPCARTYATPSRRRSLLEKSAAPAPGGKADAARRGAGGVGEREQHVEQLVAAVEGARGRQDGRDRRAGQCAADDGDRAVGEHEQQDQRQPEAVGDGDEQREHRGLDEVERRQRATHGQAVQARGQGGRDERRREGGGEEQRGRGERAPGPGEDEDRQRHRAEAEPQLVERVARREAAESANAKRCQGGHSKRGIGGSGGRRERRERPAPGRLFEGERECPETREARRAGRASAGVDEKPTQVLLWRLAAANGHLP